jgi:nucleotidyltransferase/DNA polymerase involved in DNA repair
VFDARHAGNDDCLPNPNGDYCPARNHLAPTGGSAEVIAPLPLAALRLAPALAAELRMLGFECIADLMALPRAPLALRFGPEIGRRLDQALGHVAEPILYRASPVMSDVPERNVRRILAMAPEMGAHSGRRLEFVQTKPL